MPWLLKVVFGNGDWYGTEVTKLVNGAVEPGGSLRWLPNVDAGSRVSHRTSFRGAQSSKAADLAESNGGRVVEVGDGFERRWPLESRWQCSPTLMAAKDGYSVVGNDDETVEIRDGVDRW